MIYGIRPHTMHLPTPSVLGPAEPTTEFSELAKDNHKIDISSSPISLYDTPFQSPQKHDVFSEFPPASIKMDSCLDATRKGLNEHPLSHIRQKPNLVEFTLSHKLTTTNNSSTLKIPPPNTLNLSRSWDEILCSPVRYEARSPYSTNKSNYNNDGNNSNTPQKSFKLRQRTHQLRRKYISDEALCPLTSDKFTRMGPNIKFQIDKRSRQLPLIKITPPITHESNLSPPPTIQITSPPQQFDNTEDGSNTGLITFLKSRSDLLAGANNTALEASPSSTTRFSVKHKILEKSNLHRKKYHTFFNSSGNDGTECICHEFALMRRRSNCYCDSYYYESCQHTLSPKLWEIPLNYNNLPMCRNFKCLQNQPELPFNTHLSTKAPYTLTPSSRSTILHSSHESGLDKWSPHPSCLRSFQITQHPFSPPETYHVCAGKLPSSGTNTCLTPRPFTSIQSPISRPNFSVLHLRDSTQSHKYRGYSNLLLSTQGPPFNSPYNNDDNVTDLIRHINGTHNTCPYYSRAKRCRMRPRKGKNIKNNATPNEYSALNMTCPAKTVTNGTFHRSVLRKCTSMIDDYIPPPTLQAIQSAVNRLYRIDDFEPELIGTGFFSEVFKVTHTQTAETMVLKVNKQNSNRCNVLREIQLMNSLSHPNILRFLGVCVNGGQLHALTEFINGGNLEQLILDAKTELGWEVRVNLGIDITKGMRYLHSQGIFHRDLTSKNCLVRRDGEDTFTAIVGDLGLAAKIPPKKPSTSSTCNRTRLPIVGSPYWMAPECLQGKFYDEKADIFSFGIILCEMIARIEADPDILPRTMDFGLDNVAFTKMCPQAPTDFLELAFKCCQVDPDVRPPSFSAILKLLRVIVNKYQTLIYISSTAHHNNCLNYTCNRRRRFSFARTNTGVIRKALSDEHIDMHPWFYDNTPCRLYQKYEAPIIKMHLTPSLEQKNSLLPSNCKNIPLDNSPFKPQDQLLRSNLRPDNESFIHLNNANNDYDDDNIDDRVKPHMSGHQYYHTIGSINPTHSNCPLNRPSKHAAFCNGPSVCYTDNYDKYIKANMKLPQKYIHSCIPISDLNLQDTSYEDGDDYNTTFNDENETVERYIPGREEFNFDSSNSDSTTDFDSGCSSETRDELLTTSPPLMGGANRISPQSYTNLKQSQTVNPSTLDLTLSPKKLRRNAASTHLTQLRKSPIKNGPNHLDSSQIRPDIFKPGCQNMSSLPKTSPSKFSSIHIAPSIEDYKIETKNINGMEKPLPVPSFLNMATTSLRESFKRCFICRPNAPSSEFTTPAKKYTILVDNNPSPEPPASPV